jgi:hypothetical protein
MHYTPLAGSCATLRPWLISDRILALMLAGLILGMLLVPGGIQQLA